MKNNNNRRQNTLHKGGITERHANKPLRLITPRHKKNESDVEATIQISLTITDDSNNKEHLIIFAVTQKFKTTKRVLTVDGNIKEHIYETRYD